jgi:DHA1 family arabinose polymer transporter-like MFS transporter
MKLKEEFMELTQPVSMTTKKSFTMPQASLLTLALGGLSIGMTEFMMMGVLPDVAKTLSISIPSAGNLISIYALGVVTGAPLMVAIAGKYSPKKVLIALMLLFGFFNAMFAWAPDYKWLLASRFFSGLPHGAFFGIGAVVASRLAEKGKEARSVSVMFGGLTLANIIGVPIGTYIGHNLSWRISFLIVAVIALLAAASIKRWMPALPAPKQTSFKSSLKAFTKPEPWLIILMASIGSGGLFAWISYIAPLMTQVAGFSNNALTIIMIVAGIGMATGNILGGRLADKFSPLKTIGFLLITMMASLVIVALTAQFKLPAVLMTFITGTIAFALVAPMQILIIKAAEGSEMLASASLQASLNMGNALGAYLGGMPLAAGFGYTSSEYVGAGLVLIGLVFCMILMRRDAKTPLPAVVAAPVMGTNRIIRKVQQRVEKNIFSN